MPSTREDVIHDHENNADDPGDPKGHIGGPVFALVIITTMVWL